MPDSISNSISQAITANRLSDGSVVYLTPADNWSERIEECRRLHDPQAAEVMLSLANDLVAQNQVVSPYLFKINDRAGRPVPLSKREVLRTSGPSVGTDLAQA